MSEPDWAMVLQFLQNENGHYRREVTESEIEQEDFTHRISTGTTSQIPILQTQPSEEPSVRTEGSSLWKRLFHLANYAPA